MSETTRNVMVGFFVLTAMVTLGVLMVWFGETPSWLQRGEWTLLISGGEIRGIGEGSPVYVSGVEVGRVKRLEFQNIKRPDLGALLVVSIKNQFEIPSGSHAKIYGATLGIGRGQVNIIPPQERRDPLYKDGHALIFGEMASPFGEVIPPEMVESFHKTVTHVGAFAASAVPVADNLAKLLEERPVSVVDQPGAAEQGITGNVATAVERFDRFMANVNQVAGDETFRSDIKGIAAELKKAAGDARETTQIWKTESQKLADNFNGGIDSIEEDAGNLLVKLTGIAERLDKTADHLNTASAKVAEGKGTVGMFIHDPRLYESAVLSLERLSEFLASLNRIAGNIERDGYIPLEVKTGIGPIRAERTVDELIGQK